MANKRKKDNAPALQPLVEHGVSKAMVNKMAENGITIGELQNEYQLHGKKGVEVCLGVQLNGKPRVTRRAKIIDLVESFLIQKNV